MTTSKLKALTIHMAQCKNIFFLVSSDYYYYYFYYPAAAITCS